MSFHELTGGAHDFWSYVLPLVYGDDGIAAVSPAVIEIYNQMTLEKVVGLYGMVYTPENKTGVSTSISRPLSDVSFLKRGFRLCDGRWLAPLELESIILRPYWISVKGNRDDEQIQILRAIVEGILEELSLHDDETFMYWKKKICPPCEFLLTWNSLLPTNSAYHYRERVSDMEYNW
jgi:hypothetical protein